ncbi:hypothetical protein DR64_1314 [Paraburkholderia xenovorans LB400]|uniref:EthD domain-containing protein n=1 Tax=Paraburkholderia xenovorans (strain LB400) TaxID=266265 RepID=Q143W7_PARXL|nr:EthD family reductase [Paraburkholderia xenovorans]ABE29372.1 hypothetical protein Bxe_A3617 [Paraburkholderia xenovorans LB400]AIP32587.1 hypothetical protein DR64_1314 [Paraburkholderia xenovorans LB400]
MIYRSGVFSRKEGLDGETFRQHWTQVHGSLASRMPGLHSYWQNHIIERLYEREGRSHHAIDGISQLAFDDVAAMERAEISPEYAACKLDIPKFQGAITILVLEREEIVPPPALSTPQRKHKLVWVSEARADFRGEALRERWMANAATSLEAVPSPTGFVQNFVTDRSHPVQAGVPSGDIPVEAISELWLSDAAALKSFAESAAGCMFIHRDPLLKPIGIYLVEEVSVR